MAISFFSDGAWLMMFENIANDSLKRHITPMSRACMSLASICLGFAFNTQSDDTPQYHVA